jgi:hypothetical protein
MNRNAAKGLTGGRPDGTKQAVDTQSKVKKFFASFFQKRRVFDF